MQTRLHHRFYLKHLLLIPLILTSLILVSIAVFSTTLNVIEIEMLYLRQNDLTSVTIEKHATGSGGEIYEEKYVLIQGADVQTLKERLKGGMFVDYALVDSNTVIKPFYLTSANNYTTIKMDTMERVSSKRIYGRYPSNIYETAITYQTTLNSSSSQYGIQPLEFYLYQTVNWYGFPLTVTRTIAEGQPDSNLSLNMDGHVGSTTGSSSLNSGSLYIYPGLHREHSDQQQQAFVSSSERLIDKLTLCSYEVGSLCPTPCANTYYFYSGEQLHLDSDGKNQSMVREGKVLLGFSMALCLRYRSRYLEGYHDDILLS